MRSSIDKWAMDLAIATSHRAACLRRQVGCIFLDGTNHVVGTGYNGPPKGFAHCDDKATICKGAHYSSGEGLDKCLAVHAEQNALIECKNYGDIAKVYTTTFPCIHCLKMLLNTGMRRLVYIEDYSSSDFGKELLIAKGIVYAQFVP